MKIIQKECEHDYENPIKKGRAYWVCPKCGKDITIELVFMKQNETNTNKK